jgi:co-chaperonin GroES (HSP10)
MKPNQRMSPRDLNPAVFGGAPAPMDFARLTAQVPIEPAGPRLTLAPIGSWLLLDMPDELSPETQGGIIVPLESRKKFSQYVVAPVLAVGPEVRKVKVGDGVLVPRMHVVNHNHDGNAYFMFPEGAIVAIVR